MKFKKKKKEYNMLNHNKELFFGHDEHILSAMIREKIISEQYKFCGFVDKQVWPETVSFTQVTDRGNLYKPVKFTQLILLLMTAPI